VSLLRVVAVAVLELFVDELLYAGAERHDCHGLHRRLADSAETLNHLSPSGVLGVIQPYREESITSRLPTSSGGTNGSEGMSGLSAAVNVARENGLLLASSVLVRQASNPGWRQ
jgi:hypothetical protein